jgi:hypothetical protein
MAGHNRSKDGVVSLAYVPAISISGHGFKGTAKRIGIAGTNLAMTKVETKLNPPGE